MKEKKWIFVLSGTVLLTLIVFAVIMYVLDPLLQYRSEGKILSYYEYSELYSSPGIAQHYSYDTVFVGTSMIENTNMDEADELLNCKAVRLPYSGGTAHNMKYILDVCFDSRNDIKNVYWELDEFQLFSRSDEFRYPLPEYLYRNDVKKDLSYLLNLDVFYHYAVKDILGTLKGIKQPAERRGNTFSGDFSKSAVIESYDRPEIVSEGPDTALRSRRIEQNLNENIIPLIEMNPDTEFVFYFAPFSILYWDREVRSGTFENTMDLIEHVIGELLNYENVQVYFYHNETEIITDLDNYKDYSHYGPWINSLLTQKMADKDGLLNLDNYKLIIRSFRKYIENYDFDELFLENDGS